MTPNYRQPPEYHFSLDSVLLARLVAETINAQSSKAQPFRVLDLCAGVGVIGLDLATHCEWIQTIDFLEVQPAYHEYLVENLRLVTRPQLNCQVTIGSFADPIVLASLGHYQLILCNPPYFRLGQGKLSPSELKNRSRFMIDSDWPELWRSLGELLAKDGQAFVLQRQLPDHGWNLFQESVQQCEVLGLQVSKWSEIRGTDVLRVFRSAPSKR